MNDKPGIIAAAQQAEAAAQQAQGVVSAVLSGSQKDIAMKVLGGVATVGGAVAAGLKAGTPAGWIAAGVGVVIWVAGLLHSSPSQPAAK